MMVEHADRAHGVLSTGVQRYTDRDVLFLGPGLFQLVPRRIPIPSRGVLERELLRRLGGSLFTSEEMLFLLGEPGVD